MSDVFAWSIAVLPTLVAAVLAGRLMLLRRREAELGWELAVQQSALAAETAQHIRSKHAAELARTIHDDLGHRLTLAAIETAALRTRVGDAVGPDLEHLRSSIAECVEALNRSVSGLGDQRGDSRFDFDIEGIVEQIRGTGGSVQVDATFSPASKEAPDLSAAVELVLLSVAREGCTNALRHAPGATIQIHVGRVADTVVLDVENGAVGDAAALPAAPSGAKRGLQGLSTQIEALGGALAAGPHDGGWRLRARVPLIPVAGVDEVRKLLSRRQRQTWHRLVFVPVGVAAILIALPIAAVLGQAALSSLSTTDFASISVGQPQGVALAQLPRIEMEAPPGQVGSGDCRHYESTFSPFDRTDVHEVCFADGRVSSTTIIPAP